MPERGTAIVGWNAGRISPDAGGGLVKFDIHTFSNIPDGARVFFVRSASDPSWASSVSLASHVNALLEAARPDRGFDDDAQEWLQGLAMRMVAETQFAPEAELAEGHYAHAMQVMRDIRGAIPPEPGDEPVDRATLRGCLP